MNVIQSIFGFYFKEKVTALKSAVTWGYMLAGVCLIMGVLAPVLNFSFYFAFVWLSWALWRGRVTRSGMFYFWLSYCLMVGFGVWQYVFPWGLGPILAILFAFLLGNLFYLLQAKVTTNWGKCILLPAGFFAFEYLFHSVPGLYIVEFPLMLGFIYNHTPIIRLVMLTGSSVGLFCLVLMINTLTVFFLERKWKSAVLAVPTLLLALLIMANVLTGTSSAGDVVIAAVQGSTAKDTHSLMGQEYLDLIFTTYANLINKAEADIILFPEVSMAVYFPEQKQYDGNEFVELARATDSLLIPVVTEYRRGAQGQEQRYITALVVSAKGILGKSSKRNLVPFSEAGSVSAGTGYEPIQTELGKLGIAICYDINNPKTITRLKANGSEIVLAPFNDSGFGVVYHRIHAHYSVLRALENNIPIVVANEDGISQIVDRDGTVLMSLGLGRQGMLTANLAMSSAPGFYTACGVYLDALLALVLLIFLSFGHIRHCRRRSDEPA